MDAPLARRRRPGRLRGLTGLELGELRARHHTSRIDRPRRIETPLAAIAVLAGVVIAALGCSPLGSDCKDSAAFGVRRYVPVQIQQEGAFTPRELVGYTRVECGDDIGEQRRLVSIAAVPAEIALLDGDRADVMYVAAGRCVDAEGWDAFAACLVERLTFGDRWYSRTELDELDRGRELGPGVVYTAVESRSVDVAALVGVAPERALVSAGEPRVVWIADGSCYEGVPEDREACLLNGAG